MSSGPDLLIPRCASVVVACRVCPRSIFMPNQCQNKSWQTWSIKVGKYIYFFLHSNWVRRARGHVLVVLENTGISHFCTGFPFRIYGHLYMQSIWDTVECSRSCTIMLLIIIICWHCWIHSLTFFFNAAVDVDEAFVRLLPEYRRLRLSTMDSSSTKTQADWAIAQRDVQLHRLWDTFSSCDCRKVMLTFSVHCTSLAKINK